MATWHRHSEAASAGHVLSAQEPAIRSAKKDLPDAETDASGQQTVDFPHLLTVFSVSAAMVGVCLTAISLIQIVQRLSQIATVADAILVVDAAFFLAAMFGSFVAMRMRFRGRWRAVALSADVAILLGMVLMVLCCAVLAWSLV